MERTSEEGVEVEVEEGHCWWGWLLRGCRYGVVGLGIGGWMVGGCDWELCAIGRFAGER